jgi:hypothetical protein
MKPIKSIFTMHYLAVLQGENPDSTPTTFQAHKLNPHHYDDAKSRK